MIFVILILLPLTWLCWNILFPLIRIVVNYTYGVKHWSARNCIRVSGDWAVVTGACGPLGRAYVCELAGEKLHVLLLDKDKNALEELATHIGQTYGVLTQLVAADLTTSKDYEEINRRISSLPSIGCLVNAAEFRCDPTEQPMMSKGSMESLDFVERMILCNVQSMAAITRICLPKMIHQVPFKASIINVSSALATISCPKYSLYAASKCFAPAFSRSLRNELRLPSITIQAVCPGPLTLSRRSTFTSKAGTIWAPSPDKFVHSSLTMLGIEDETCGYLPHAILALFMQYIPHSFISKAWPKFSKSLACEPTAV
ncbi:unnamed protein product [Echinostoma caproni]|uniref:Estradiol 17-beta-dehydrogenase 2 n=1 Tax=Echinostoma caproni TaxID=27848 RepID=A0A183B0G6_9TREM|nr:unnamed protein product [Echinostoma caproni]